MDKPLPKIGGITIERVPKPTSASTSSSSNLSQGNPAKTIPNKFPAAEEYDDQVEDEFGEDDYDVDFPGTEGDDENWQEGEEVINEESAPVTPFLPPGVTIQRKSQTPPATATVKPNIKLPPGISLGKQTNSRQKASPKSTFQQNVRGLQSTQFSPRTQQIAFPRPNASFMRPDVPVRAVRPRAKLDSPRRMMINDFLEQRMKIGPNHLGVQRPPMPRASRTPTTRPRAHRPRAPKPFPLENIFPAFSYGTSPSKHFFPTSNIQPRFASSQKPASSSSNLANDSDTDEDQPLRPSTSKVSPFKIPPGIDIARRSSPQLKQSQQSTVKSEKIQLPVGVSYGKETVSQSQTRLSTNIQLPAGISFERKNPLPQVSVPQQEEEEDEYEEDNAADDELEDEYTEEFESQSGEVEESATPPLSIDKQKPSSNIQLPLGVTFQKRTLENTDSVPIPKSTYASESLQSVSKQELQHEEIATDLETDLEHTEDNDGEAEEPECEYDDEAMESEHDADQSADYHENDPEPQEGEQDTKNDDLKQSSDNDLAEDEYEEQQEHNLLENYQSSGVEFSEPNEEADGENFAEDGDENPGEDEGETPEIHDGMEADKFDNTEIDFETLIATPIPIVPTGITFPAADSEITNELDSKADLENLMELMSKGEIEGEIEDDVEDKKGLKRKVDEEEQLEGESDDKRIKDDDDDEDQNAEGDEDGADVDKSKVASSHLRKNIREVMDETKLDETTLAAQRQEAERLKRLSEQQRILREVKRQIQLSKAAEKAQNQSNVLSLLKGNTDLTLKKNVSGFTASTSRNQDSVLLKMGNGQQACLNDRMRELLRIPEKSAPVTSDQSTRSLFNKGMLSSSVTIAPIKKEPRDGEKGKKGDVVTLSSDSDDCVVLSEEEAESEPEDDPTNSGMHTSDKYNIPDEHGRILVNVGHPPEETDVFLAPQIAKIIKPHQIGGVRFLYDNIIESPERYESSPGFGCILAHSMGLGKTLQIVAFSDVFLRHTSAKKILCIMPINTIQNWQAEYNMWLPMDHSGEGDVLCRNFNVYVVNESAKNIHSRGKVILDWQKNGGVLLMGYELYRLLSLKKPIKSKRKRPNDDEEKKNHDLVEDIYSALVNPGPDLIICDEGHRIKNSHATTSQALKQIRTKRRVVLTGYPLQNNLLEYWCMVDFVRPNYLGSKTEFSNMFERPIQNGQCIDSTPQDKRLMRYRAHVLHALLEGFVQRRSHAVLQQTLPQKQEYVLLLRFTPFQKLLYKTCMDEVIRPVAVPNPLKAFAVSCKIWNHPDVLYNFLKKKGEQRDLDLEETLPATIAPPLFPMDMMALAPSNPTWPKRGPGSRGGKVRQRKGKVSPHHSTPSTLSKDPIDPLPSINHFQMQNAPNTRPGYAASSNFQQTAVYNQSLQQYSQTRQPDMPYPGFEAVSQQGDSQHTFNEQFDNKQAFSSNYPHDQFYQGQDQYSQPGGSTPASQEQYYQQGSQGFEYNQSSDLTSDFSQMAYSDSGFGGSNFSAELPQQQNAWGSSWGASSQGGYSSSSDEFMSPPKFSNFDEKKETSDFMGGFPGNLVGDGNQSRPSSSADSGRKPQLPTTPIKDDDKKEEKELKRDEISYDWAHELFKNYVPGVAENSSKMEVFLLILEESIPRGDRLLVFSQSLLTLDLIEDYLQKRKVPGREEHWAKNRNYFRLDGSTQALEREKLINEFNKTDTIQMFLVSTRAGSLGINLVGANRVVVFDASWNPCHDIQAVCRVYRYGQKKPCYVYRLVMDSSLEKRIYDRQINKQGMADRIVDELNPDAHLALKDVTNLCCDDQEDTPVTDFSDQKDRYHDDIVQLMLEKCSSLFSRAPFQHESLLVDRKEKKLSQAEKRLAKRSYELEKQAANNPRGIHHLFPNAGARGFTKPIASVKPMQSGVYGGYGGMPPRSKWIPPEVWQKQGMTAQELTLPLDVVIPTNSPDKTSIVLKAGQRVMVLKSPKGIYMQLETGKIIAIRTSLKMGATPSTSTADKSENRKSDTLASALKNNPNVTITKSSASQRNPKLPPFFKPSTLDKQAAAVNMAATKGRVIFNSKNRPPPIIKKPVLKKPDGLPTATLTSEIASPGQQDLGSQENEIVTADVPLAHTPGPIVSEAPLNDSQNVSTAWNETIPPETNNMAGMMSSPGVDLPIESPASQPNDLPQTATTEFPDKSNLDVKKEPDPQNPWAKQGYPMDPYGNYYPGYPGYYGPPMPGFDPYLGYTPMPQIKTEASGDTPPPTTPQQLPATRPPMYPPYHAPYPYHPYNYPPYPPQGQPGTSIPPAVPPQVKVEQGEPNASAFIPPPYGPRPPYPQPTSGPPPGYYPNYPYPPRPYHDPNYPFPNYNPYMPPAGYGYPVPNTTVVSKPATEGNSQDTMQQ